MKQLFEIIEDFFCMGMIASMIISWSMYQSFWWMVFHGICGWFYILYWAIFL